MDWTMHECQSRELLLESGDGSLAPVRTPIVDDPENTSGVVVGRASRDFLDKAIEGCDTGGGFTAAKDTGMMNIESSEVGPGTAPLVFVFDAHLASGAAGNLGCLRRRA